MDRVTLNASLIALSAGFVLPPGTQLIDDESAGSRLRVVGRDSVKGARRRQPRNQLCRCGSGRKAKRCCIWEEV